MTDTLNTTPDFPEAADDEISLLDLAIVLAKYKKTILGVPFAAAVLAAGVSLLMPNIYTATTRIMPPQQGQSTAAAMLGQLGALAGGLSGSLGIKNPNDLYVGMIKSRTVADAMIERFKLKDEFESETMMATRTALEGITRISAGKDGIISVDVDHEDPEKAATYANAYIEELTRMMQTLAVSEAGQRRIFFEQQLKRTKDELAAAEEGLRSTQETTGLIKLEEQGKAIIDAAAQLQAQIAAKEIQIAAMRGFVTEQNPDLQRARQELAAMRVQLQKAEDTAPRRGDVLVPTGKIPEVGMSYVRALRELKYQEAMFEVLAKQYELARIDEARDAAIIQVIDQAVPPDRKSKPKRALIVILTALAVGFMTVLWVFIKEAISKAKEDPESSGRLSQLQTALRWR